MGLGRLRRPGTCPRLRGARASASPSSRWCAWQESNLLPHAPQACALSGELQARQRMQFTAVALANAALDRLGDPAGLGSVEVGRAQERGHRPILPPGYVERPAPHVPLDGPGVFRQPGCHTLRETWELLLPRWCRETEDHTLVGAGGHMIIGKNGDP